MSVLSANDLDFGSVSVTADGTKTLNQLLGELYNQLNLSKIKRNSWLVTKEGNNNLFYHIIEKRPDGVVFARAFVYSSVSLITFNIGPGVNTVGGIEGGVSVDYSNNVFANGNTITIYY